MMATLGLDMFAAGAVWVVGAGAEEAGVDLGAGWGGGNGLGVDGGGGGGEGGGGGGGKGKRSKDGVSVVEHCTFPTHSLPLQF